MSRLSANADNRPRIHVWRTDTGGISWSHGPTGSRIAASSPGNAVDQAMRHLGDKEAVIIIEPVA